MQEAADYVFQLRGIKSMRVSELSPSVFMIRKCSNIHGRNSSSDWNGCSGCNGCDGRERDPVVNWSSTSDLVQTTGDPRRLSGCNGESVVGWSFTNSLEETTGDP